MLVKVGNFKPVLPVRRRTRKEENLDQQNFPDFSFTKIPVSNTIFVFFPLLLESRENQEYSSSLYQFLEFSNPTQLVRKTGTVAGWESLSC